ncbi:MAG: ribosome recycling factor [Microgenomates group bacterium]
MIYNFTPLKTKVKDVEEWLKKENAQIRTGRASISLLDFIRVDSYGSLVPLNQIGSISTEDPRTIRISPWDSSQIKEIEKVLVASNLGVSVSVDDKGIRVCFPPLTTERRDEFIKVAKTKLEQARVSLRKHRDETWEEIQAKEKEGGMSEDDKFRFKTEMEKIIQDTVKSLEALYEKKESEISG